MEVRLPELSDGIDKATVTKLLAQPGQAIAAGAGLLEVETDKATIEVPAAVAGTLAAFAVKPGDVVKVGAVIATFAGNGSSAPPAPTKASAAPPTKAPAPPAKAVAPAKPAPAVAPAKVGRVPFHLPPLGEGIKSARVNAVLTQVGDALTAEQTLFECETDKATVPVPSPVAGTLLELKVTTGQEIEIGTLVAVIESASMPGSAAPAATPSEPTPEDRPTTVSNVPTPVATAMHPTKPVLTTSSDMPPSDLAAVPAGPATRRLARELGVDLRRVKGSARGGRVTLDDIKAFVHEQLTKPQAASAGGAFVVPPLPDFSKWGPIERKPVSGVRRKTAENLTLSWHVCPAVTHFDLADITDLEAGRKRYVEQQPKGAVKITMTVLALKGVVAALKAFPQFNASYDPHAGEAIYKKYVNIGVAVDTEHGLFVPVLRDVDQKSISTLARELNDKAELARTKKLPIDDMRGGTFTITNLGGIGGIGFTPIINYPEVAILGLSRSALQPSVREGQIVPRLMLPMCLTYDHRLIDGADAARFCAFLSRLLSDPARLLMEA